mmetsp:Transcript_14646/g.39928  ORF Transcript_14646/g.39928 Transcript_14646/m.39928 type:complete len:414 (+) Transcript_14646:54-1295(+)
MFGMKPWQTLAAVVALVCLSNVANALVLESSRPLVRPSLGLNDQARFKLNPAVIEKSSTQMRLRGAGHGGGNEAGTGSTLELLICVSGIYFCYIYYGVLQEDLLTSQYNGKSFKEVCSVLFLQAVQCVIGAVCSRVACLTAPQPASGWQNLATLSGENSPSAPWFQYTIIGFCYILAMFFSNYALFFVNYPTQVIVKSCKMIPVMASGVLLHGKHYSLAAYLRVVMVTVGLILFTFFKKSKGAAASAARSQVVGLGLAFLSLTMDGFVSPNQEAVFSKYKTSTHQMMYYTNLWALVLLAVVLPITGEGQRALGFVAKNPAVLSKIIQFGLMSAVGQFFIFYLVRSFSALTLVTVTTTRKFFTVLGSIFLFNHPMTIGQWGSVALVFIGLGWEEAAKYLEKQAKKAKKAAAAPA